jgi:ADP-heptose:LPS heptosyltransferase
VTDLSRPVLLVLRALGLGDLCTAVPALRALRAAHPGHRLVLAAPRWQEPLARLAGVDEVAATEGLEPLPSRWRGVDVDVAVNLHGRGPQSSARLAALGPGRLLAFHHPDVPATHGGPQWRQDEHEVHRWCRLLRSWEVAADPSDLRLPVPEGARSEHPGAVVVHPGAASPARQWPAERFARVVRVLAECGQRVVLTGSAQERARCEEVVRLARLRDERGTAQVVAGSTDLIGLAATVAAARALVCGDTGVAHLASAFGTPSVVLFGPTPPAWWGPPVDGPHRTLWKGRTGDPHGDELDPGLAEIAVSEVLDELGSLLGPVLSTEDRRVRV